MISSETILNYPDWENSSTVHTGASDQQLGDVISQNEKPTYLFLRKLSKLHHNYTKA